MPNKDPESRLDRIARDLSRTLLHGSRPADLDGNVRPATVLTGQQVRVDLPTGDLNFDFRTDVSTARVVVDHALAAQTEQFMKDAVGMNRAKYLGLTVDSDIPVWIFQQRQFPFSRVASSEQVPVGSTLTVMQLPSSVIKEVTNSSSESYVSLFSIDPIQQSSTVIPAAQWQPAIFLRFPLRKMEKPPAGLPTETKVYELLGTPQGDRWFLDQLGLLWPADKPPEIKSISFTLEFKDSQGQLQRSPELSEWSIARANLTQESRPPEFTETTVSVAPPSALPYVVLSGDVGQEEDALRLLGMASITNSGGYYFAAKTDLADAKSLLLAVVLKPKIETGTANQESAWLPLAANAIAVAKNVSPDVVRFNGIDEIEIAPATPPGTVSFGWTRKVPKEPTSADDKFGYGTLSIVDYSATDGSGQAIPMPDGVPVISPMQKLPGKGYKKRGAETVDNQNLGSSGTASSISAMRLQGGQDLEASTAALDAGGVETHYYRGTIRCYGKDESPWQRLSDAKRRQILVKPGFRDVFGNRFDAEQAPIFQNHLFYTDPIINPADWPGLRFVVYPDLQNGRPVLAVELVYDGQGFNENSSRRLQQIHDQLRGAGNDVTLSFLAEPLVSAPKTLDIAEVIKNLALWSTGGATSVVPLGSFVCDGTVSQISRFEPKIRIERKPDYLPFDADLPQDPIFATLIRNQITAVTAAIGLQKEAAPAQFKPGDPERRDEFLCIAKKLQTAIGSTHAVRVGLMRDHLNLHGIWLIPNSFFPSVPSGDASAAWSFATPCPVRNVLGNESFQVPDFTTTTKADPVWKKYEFPLRSQAVVDQDFDELGRVAFRMLERETADVGSLMQRGNAVTMRSLLKTREDIANQLATFNSAGTGPGFMVPTFANARPGDLDSDAVARIAKDAFLADLTSFYTLSTIIQLPLDQRGDKAIQTFHGEVDKNAQLSDPNQPTFSDVLLGGDKPKLTVLYDLPPGRTEMLPLLPSLAITLFHIQLPLPNVPAGGNQFNEGPWIELIAPVQLSWKGFAESVPVALRKFPSKPIIRSAGSILPKLSPEGVPQKINAANARLLSQWGWTFSFSMVDGSNQDKAYVSIQYPQNGSARALQMESAALEDWDPVTLLNTLTALKLLADYGDSATLRGKRLAVLDDLVRSLLKYLSSGPSPTLRSESLRDGAAALRDTFTVGFRDNSRPQGSFQVMTGEIKVGWDPQATVAPRIDTATVTADPKEPGNNAYLTGTTPVRDYKVSLTLKRNETFNNRDAHPLLVYQCAPVEYPEDSRPLNRWGPLEFDMTDQALNTALPAFFEGIFHGADLAKLDLETGLSLLWSKGAMSMATPFSILPVDIKPGNGTAKDISDVVQKKCEKLLGGTSKKPSETDSAAIRVRVKITAPDNNTPHGRRTLVEIPAVDFALPG